MRGSRAAGSVYRTEHVLSNKAARRIGQAMSDRLFWKPSGCESMQDATSSAEICESAPFVFCVARPMLMALTSLIAWRPSRAVPPARLDVLGLRGGCGLSREPRVLCDVGVPAPLLARPKRSGQSRGLARGGREGGGGCLCVAGCPGLAMKRGGQKRSGCSQEGLFATPRLGMLGERSLLGRRRPQRPLFVESVRSAKVAVCLSVVLVRAPLLHDSLSGPDGLIHAVCHSSRQEISMIKKRKFMKLPQPIYG